MPNWLKVSLVFIGTVIGAGFASGQEIIQFFIIYGEKSIWGIVISGVLFGLIATAVMCKISVTGASSMEDYFGDIMNGAMLFVLDLIITLFMLSSFCIMVAGSGAVFHEQLILPLWLGIATMCAICIFVFWRGIDGIVELNALLTPIMIVGIIILGAYIYATNGISAIFSVDKLQNNWLLSSIIYVSYNTLTLVVVMTALNKLIESKATAVVSALFGGTVLCAMAAILWWILYNMDTAGAELPMLHAAGAISSVAKGMYLPILYIAMLTTAVANGFGVIKNIKVRFGISEKLGSVLICLVALAVGFAGFGWLVGRLYSLFGFVGLGVMLIILIDGIKYMKY